MATVTEVREFRGIVALSLDGACAVRIRKKHFDMRPLQVGDEVEMEAYLDSVAAVQMHDAYEAALCCLDRSARTEAEIVRALEQRGYVRPCVQAVAARLVENRLLDDKRYAQRMAERHASRPVGAYAIQRKLRAKGISEENAEAAMQIFDERQQREAAREAANGLIRKYRNLPKREARGKLSQALARRGFGWDAIQEVVDALLEEEFEET